MGLTERGRWTSSSLDEHGRIIISSLTESGQKVIGNVSTTTTPTSTPYVTINSIDHSKIGKTAGIDRSTVAFQFDQDVTAWEVRVMGAGQGSGILADSGGSVKAGTTISAVIDWTEMYQEGDNQVNIYGQNSVGWTPYESNGATSYYLSMNGTTDYLKFTTSTISFDKIVMDINIDTTQSTGYAYIYSVNEGNSGWERYQGGQSFFGDFSGIAQGEVAGQRTTIVFDMATQLSSSYTTNDLVFCNRYSGSNGYNTKALLYSIQLYYQGAIVANYDFTKGNTKDISGNGYDLVLTGGTWLTS